MKHRYLMLSMLLLFSTAEAFTWQNLWQRPDEQAMEALKKNQPKQASSLFTDPAWQAVAYYRAADYQRAYELFKNDNSAAGFYNRGNALAFMGQYNAAIEAYKQALKLQQDFPDAEFNKKIIEDLLKSQQQGNKQPEQTQQKSPNTDKTIQIQNNAKQPQNNSSEQSSANNNSQLKSPKDATPPNPGNNIKTSAANDKKSRDTTQANTAQIEQEQAINQWLQSIPDEPGGLLQQKFLRDHANYQQLEQEGQAPWQNG